MAISDIPSGLNENNIGKVVKIQVLRRVNDDSDTLAAESLEKYVGVIEAYSHDRTDIKIKIRGLDTIIANRRKQTVEVYL